MAQAAIEIKSEVTLLTIRPSRGWASLNLRDLWLYRELVYFLTWRDLKVRYKQTLLGASWAILQPFLTMVVFSIIFGKLAKLPSDNIPYPIFTYTALLPWGLFVYALNNASRSLVANSHMITKVYFPRLVLPLSSILAGLVDFAIAFVVLIGLMVYYGYAPVTTPQATEPPTPIVAFAAPTPTASADTTAVVATNTNASTQPYRFALTPAVLTLPLFLLLAIVTALGVALWLSALNVMYRDVGHAIPFLTQIWLFITPIVYSSRIVPPEWQMIYALNPMAGVVNGFRWALLGTQPFPGPLLAVSAGISVLILVSGLFYFRRMEKTFADMI